MSEKMRDVLARVSPQGAMSAFVIRQLESMLGDMLVSEVVGMYPIDLSLLIEARRIEFDLASTVDFGAVALQIFDYLRCMGFISTQRE